MTFNRGNHLFPCCDSMAQGTCEGGLIPAESNTPHVTLMYIYVFRLFLYLGCWQKRRWLRGRCSNSRGARLPCGAVIGVRAGSGAGLWDYSSISLRRSSGHLEQPYQGIKPPSTEHGHRPPTYPRVRSLFPDSGAAGCAGRISGGRLLRSGETDGPFVRVKTRRYSD